MSAFKLAEGLYLYPTASGAYYAISASETDTPRLFLQNLLLQSVTPELTVQNINALSGLDDGGKAMELLHHCQKLGWIQGVKDSIKAPGGALEEILPGLLKPLAETGKVLLADNQGFYLACCGFAHETAEELSALSAEIATVHQRRSGLLTHNLGLASQAWAIVDAFGNSQIGFWPVYIGKIRFVIVISGVPHFNQAEFVDLIWALSIRYSGS